MSCRTASGQAPQAGFAAFSADGREPQLRRRRGPKTSSGVPAVTSASRVAASADRTSAARAAGTPPNLIPACRSKVSAFPPASPNSDETAPAPAGGSSSRPTSRLRTLPPPRSSIACGRPRAAGPPQRLPRQAHPDNPPCPDGGAPCSLRPLPWLSLLYLASTRVAGRLARHAAWMAEQNRWSQKSELHPAGTRRSCMCKAPRRTSSRAAGIIGKRSP